MFNVMIIMMMMIMMMMIIIIINNHKKTEIGIIGISTLQLFAKKQN